MASEQPHIVSVATATPPRRFSQEEVLQLAGYTQPMARRIFFNSDIESRYLFLAPEDKPGSETLDDLHRRYRTGAILLARQAAERCLAQAGLRARDVNCILVCSCTGYLCPDLSTILVKEMALSPCVQRGSLLGLGCAGALPGLQRAYDHALAYPEHRVLLIAVEICSAAYYFDDTMETLVGNAICADGAAACLITCRPARRDRGPAIAGFASVLDPSLQDLVGLEQRQGRLRIILAPTIRDVAPGIAEQALGELLTAQGLERQNIRFWLLHPGGRKVIDRVQEALGLTDEDVAVSRRVLRNYGNMSSPTVLFVLHEVMRDNAARAGDRGVLLALGPGLAAEAALLAW